MEEQQKAKRKLSIKPLYIAGIATLAVILIVAAYFASTAAGGTVAVGDSVSVYYTGSFTNGTIFNTNRNGTLFNFTVGANQVIPGFDNAVIGMSKGESKTVTVPPAQAYGYVNQSLFAAAPLSAFGANAPVIGEIVTTSRGLHGLVTAVNATNATIDFNPPLAGKTLVFNITVVSIRR
jgi:FKBP-type peptidyl-prolyl cis-trans isomerase 2